MDCQRHLAARMIEQHASRTYDTKMFQVIQLRDDTLQVANAITVGVVERSGIDLIHNAFFEVGSFLVVCRYRQLRAGRHGVGTGQRRTRSGASRIAIYTFSTGRFGVSVRLPDLDLVSTFIAVRLTLERVIRQLLSPDIPPRHRLQNSR